MFAFLLPPPFLEPSLGDWGSFSPTPKEINGRVEKQLVFVQGTLIEHLVARPCSGSVDAEWSKGTWSIMVLIERRRKKRKMSNTRRRRIGKGERGCARPLLSKTSK